MKNRCFSLVLIGMLALVLFHPLDSFAAFEGEGLTIFPPIVELAVDPGDSNSQKIRVSNPTNNMVEVYPKALDFRAGGEGGEPVFYSDAEEKSSYSLSKWITFGQPILVLAPQQVAEFYYTINVPQGAEPGGHYGAVFLLMSLQRTMERQVRF